MRYNPYEPKKDRKRRIESNISICVIIGLFIFGVVLMILPNDYGKKYYFESTATDIYNFSDTNVENNEFYDLYNAMLNPTTEFEMDGGFSKQYPTVAKLFNMDLSVYNKDKPFVLYGGKHMAVSQCFYSTKENQKTLDVALFGFDAKLKQSTASIEINEITRFTLIYDASNGSINYINYDNTKFSLQINSFTVTLGGGTLKQAGYTLTLNPTKGLSETDMKLLTNTIVDTTNNSVQNPTVSETDDKTVIELKQNGTEFADRIAKYKFDMAGDAPQYFQNYIITAEFQSGTRADDIEYSFTIS